VCASPLAFLGAFDSLFRVLLIFPSRYLVLYRFSGLYLVLEGIHPLIWTASSNCPTFSKVCLVIRMFRPVIGVSPTMPHKVWSISTTSPRSVNTHHSKPWLRYNSYEPWWPYDFNTLTYPTSLAATDGIPVGFSFSAY
jgi:hypothetical protein